MLRPLHPLTTESNTTTESTTTESTPSTPNQPPQHRINPSPPNQPPPPDLICMQESNLLRRISVKPDLSEARNPPLPEKFYQWIWRQQEEGSRVATVDVLNYIQNELDYCGEEPSMSPRALLHQQQSQPVMCVPSSGFPATLGSSGQPNTGQGFRSEQCDNQPKNSVFSNAFSSPARRTLQQAGSYSSGFGNRNTEPSFLHQQSRDSVTFSSNDSAMDMHAD